MLVMQPIQRMTRWGIVMVKVNLRRLRRVSKGTSPSVGEDIQAHHTHGQLREAGRPSESGDACLSVRIEGETWLTAALRPEIVSLVPLSPAIAVESCQLPGQFHADPADRLIVATARLHGLTLITADEAIRSYPHLRTLWD